MPGTWPLVKYTTVPYLPVDNSLAIFHVAHFSDVGTDYKNQKNRRYHKFTTFIYTEQNLSKPFGCNQPSICKS